MSFDLTSTSNKAGDYMKTYLDATATNADSLLPALKALAKGTLQALSEDETGFNQPPGDGGSVSGALTGEFIQGIGRLVRGNTSVNAVSGSVSFGVSFSGDPTLVATPVASAKFRVTGIGGTGFTWDTDDGSNFNGVIHWIVVGAV